MRVFVTRDKSGWSLELREYGWLISTTGVAVVDDDVAIDADGARKREAYERIYTDRYIVVCSDTIS